MGGKTELSQKAYDKMAWEYDSTQEGSYNPIKRSGSDRSGPGRRPDFFKKGPAPRAPFSISASESGSGVVGCAWNFVNGMV